MKIQKIITEPQFKITSKKCDCCNEEYQKDDLAFDEFLDINFVGGYDSIFGDMTSVECDLCQNCIEKLLGPYLRKSTLT